MNQEQLDALNVMATALETLHTQLTDFIAANPVVDPAAFVPTEAQVQAAVDAGIIAAYTPTKAAA